MRQTTLFGTPPNQAKNQPTIQNSQNNQSSKKNGRKSLEQKTSPRVALSDYFKNSVKISNSSPEQNVNTNQNVDKTSVTSITENISVVSIESHSEENIKNSCIDLTETEKNFMNTPKIHSNQITSHFLPKKVLDFEPESNENVKMSEDEKSLFKNMTKTKQKVEFIDGDIIGIENFTTILMLTEFFSDFSDILEHRSKVAFKPPKFDMFYEALKTCQPHENFKILAPLLVPIVNFLISEPLPYFDREINDFPVSQMNVSSLLRLYSEQKDRKEQLKILKDDLYCLPCGDKISIFCLLIDELLSLSEFRNFYEERSSNIESLKRNLKFLNEDINNFKREQMALKLYRTEKSQNETQDKSNNENEVDKENINHSPNQHSTDEDIDTRLQRVLSCINNTQRDINKVKAKIEKYQNISSNKKMFGTDSYGRSYYRLNSYNDKVVLVEVDSQMQLISKDKVSKECEKSQKDTNTVNGIVEKIMNSCTISDGNSHENDGLDELKQSQTFKHMTPSDANILWMEFGKDEQLKHLVRFLKKDSCGKKFYLQIEEIVSTLENNSQTQLIDSADEVEVRTHFLRSSLKNNAKCETQFTIKGFNQQLLDFADDLFMSALVSTKLKYTEWSELLTEEEVARSEFNVILEKLLKLIDHLLPACTSHLELEPITTQYIANSPLTLSQLFLLLEFFEKNIDRTYSCYELTCKKCYRKSCWDGVKYTPLVLCTKCSKSYHLTCQQPAVPDITVGWECNRCDSPNSFPTNNFYKTRNEISDDDSSEAEVPSERKKSLRPRKEPVSTLHEYSSSPEVPSKREKKRRCHNFSSESDDQSPLNKRKTLRGYTFQPVEKKLRPKTTEYTSKLRSSCF